MSYTLFINTFTLLLISLFSGLNITPGLYITSPESGAIVEGVIDIRGSMPEEGFSTAEVLYSYAQTDKETWFLIKRLDKVVQDDVLAAWDTTTITDGVYSVKLVVKTSDGTENQVIVENIQVSNYTRVQVRPDGNEETQTGKISAAAELIAATAAPAGDRVNPASILQQEVQRTVISAIIFAAAALGFLAVYTSIQSRRRRR